VTPFGTSVLAGVAAGGGIGLLLGGIALWLSWRQWEPRMTSVAQSYQTTGIPTTALDDLERDQAKAIVRRWETMSARSSSRIALVAADRKLEPLARRAAEWFSALPAPEAAGGNPRGAAGRAGSLRQNDGANLPVLHDRRPTMVATGSSDENSSEEAEARRSDVIVLVVRSAARVDEVVDRARELDRLGHRPDWVLLVDSVRKTGRGLREPG
jgi:hypothetical protein